MTKRELRRFKAKANSPKAVKEYKKWTYLCNIEDQDEFVNVLNQTSNGDRDIFDLIIAGYIEVFNLKNDFAVMGITLYGEKPYDIDLQYSGNNIHDMEHAVLNHKHTSNMWLTMEKDGKNQGMRFSTFRQTIVNDKLTHLFAEDWQLATNPDTNKLSLYKANY